MYHIVYKKNSGVEKIYKIKLFSGHEDTKEICSCPAPVRLIKPFRCESGHEDTSFATLRCNGTQNFFLTYIYIIRAQQNNQNSLGNPKISNLSPPKVCLFCTQPTFLSRLNKALFVILFFRLSVSQLSK